MWRQSPAEKKGGSPSEALSPDQTPSVAPCASSFSMFSFRLCDVSAVDGKARSCDKPRFFRREVETKLATSDTSPIRFKVMIVLAHSATAQLLSAALVPGCTL